MTPWLPALLEEIWGFGSEVKASASNAGDPDLIPGSGRCPGEGNGNPLQYSCLENPMEGESHGERSLVDYSPRGRKKSDMTEWLHLHLQCYIWQYTQCWILSQVVDFRVIWGTTEDIWIRTKNYPIFILSMLCFFSAIMELRCPWAFMRYMLKTWCLKIIFKKERKSRCDKMLKTK